MCPRRSPPATPKAEATRAPTLGPGTTNKYTTSVSGPKGGLTRVLLPPAYGVIQKRATDGRSLASIAAALGLTPRQFHRVRERDPEAVAALEVGAGELNNEITDLLLTAARAGNITAMIFYAKSRLGWVEGQPAPGINVRNLQVNNIVIPPAMSAEEAARLIEGVGVPVAPHPSPPGPGPSHQTVERQ